MLTVHAVSFYYYTHYGLLLYLASLVRVVRVGTLPYDLTFRELASYTTHNVILYYIHTHPHTHTHTPTAVELNYGTVYCFKCQDYIYDANMDEVSRSIDVQLAHNKYHVSRQPVAYVAWEPTKSEIDLLRQNPKRRKVEPGSTVG